jgi:hypothetical protein
MRRTTLWAAVGPMVGAVLMPPGHALATTQDGRRPLLTAASVNLAGRPAGYEWGLPSVSDDGNRVAFISSAARMVRGVPGGCPQVYVRDRARSVTLLASGTEDGTPASGGCNTGQNLYGRTPISDDGRLVAFLSDAASLVRRGNAWAYVFVKHLDTGRLERIVLPREPSRPSNERRDALALAVSKDFRYLAVTVRLGPNGPNDVGYLYDRATGRWSNICRPGVWTCIVYAVSPAGRYTAYLFEPRVLMPNSRRVAYVFDRVTGQSRRIDGTPTADSFDPGLMSFSDDGRTLVVEWGGYGDSAFASSRATIHAVPSLRQVEHITFPGMGGVSGTDRTGRRLAISASRTGQLGFDQPTDAYLYDRATGRKTIISVTPDGRPGNGYSVPGDMTPDARTIVMYSSADNLVRGDQSADETAGTDALVATFAARSTP